MFFETNWESATCDMWNALEMTQKRSDNFTIRRSDVEFFYTQLPRGFLANILGNILNELLHQFCFRNPHMQEFHTLQRVENCGAKVGQDRS